MKPRHHVFAPMQFPIDFPAILLQAAERRGVTAAEVRLRPCHGNPPAVILARGDVWAELQRRGFTFERIAELWPTSRTTVQHCIAATRERAA